MLWPSDRVVNCIHIDYIRTLDYWYNAIDYLNFAYSYKMACKSANNNLSSNGWRSGPFFKPEKNLFFIRIKRIVIVSWAVGE